jgi:hypothetical protein
MTSIPLSKIILFLSMLTLSYAIASHVNWRQVALSSVGLLLRTIYRKKKLAFHVITVHGLGVIAVLNLKNNIYLSGCASRTHDTTECALGGAFANFKRRAPITDRETEMLLHAMQNGSSYLYLVPVHVLMKKFTSHTELGKTIANNSQIIPLDAEQQPQPSYETG